MASNLKNTIFERFYSIFDKVQDANKNVENKGTLERYNEVVGEDADDFVYPAIDGALDNLIIPRTMLDKYIVDRENSLGNDVLFLDFTPTMRKRVLSHWHRYINIKGTIRGYEVLFNMLGISVTVTEYFDTGGFDSATTFDSDTRPTFDSGKCKSCSAYKLDLVGPPITSTIFAAILSIILFNEPINADFEGFTYNSVPTYPIVANWQYKTDMIGLHSPAFVNSGSVMFFDFTGLQTWIASNNPTFTYLNTGEKTVDVSIANFALISSIIMINQQLVSTLDLSPFPNIDQYVLNGNPNLDTILFSASSSVNITAMQIGSTLCSALDMSGLQNLGGDIDIAGANLLSWVLYAGGKSASNCTNLLLQNTALSGAIDFEHLLFNNTSNITITGNALISDISFGTTIQAGIIQDIDLRNNIALSSIDIDKLQGEIYVFDFSDNPALGTVFAGIGWGDRPSETRVYGLNTPNLSGTLDLSTMPIGTEFNMDNSGITDVIHSTSFGPIDSYIIRNCPNMTSYSLLPCEGLLGADFAVFDATDCGLSSTEVDSFLTDLSTICASIRGEVNPGLYTGRNVYIAGSNAAPTIAGNAAISILNSLGITVINN